jgi:hypothetical protein
MLQIMMCLAIQQLSLSFHVTAKAVGGCFVRENNLHEPNQLGTKAGCAKVNFHVWVL